MLVSSIEIKSNFIEPFTVYCSEFGLAAGSFRKNRFRIEKRLGLVRVSAEDLNNTNLLRIAMVQLREYFSGARKNFNLSIDYSLMTSEFQKSVLDEVSKVPYGSTSTYGEVARLLNSSARAVGGANADNPIPVIIPCHRIIGNDGNLRGYAGGIHLKEALLRLEKARLL